jgi:hypothetical protein
VNILQYCLLKHSGRTPAQLGIFDDAPEPPLGAGVTVSVAADGRLAVRYRLGHSEALYRLQRPKDGKPRRKVRPYSQFEKWEKDANAWLRTQFSGGTVEEIEDWLSVQAHGADQRR